MSARILRAEDRVAAPWKNGGGVTHEIAAWPPGADLASFDWRVSMATVAAGGPFSIFPGVDRSLSIIEGELVLAIEGRVPIHLNADTPPLAFPGDVPVHAETPPTPVRDLNVMTRRGLVQAEVSRLRLTAPHAAAAANPTLIVSRSPTLRLGGATLGMDDAALVEGEAIEIQGEPGAEVFVIHFRSV